ncbi:hypothetical protein TSUD_156050 [Trifolium subterraneum]|uniref:Uncharacterized protein n=1 Tax=Trifolium subterraneum TaxID=3900 RepID=A0A2Z6M2Z1_TRISU|nr:hypothetical protein TSUD_156050 [Trifolium subterraneum]
MAIMRQIAVIAARCVRSTTEKRPAMVEVVEFLKSVRKKIHSSSIWSSLRRRVMCVESVQPLLSWEEAYDHDYDYNYNYDYHHDNYDWDDNKSEEVVKIVKSGSSRRKSKVSSAASVEYESKPSSRE